MTAYLECDVRNDFTGFVLGEVASIKEACEDAADDIEPLSAGNSLVPSSFVVAAAVAFWFWT
jgi:hypothetical protein